MDPNIIVVIFAVVVIAVICFILYSYCFHDVGLETQLWAPNVMFSLYSCSYCFIVLYIPALEAQSIPHSLKVTIMKGQEIKAVLDFA